MRFRTRLLIASLNRFLRSAALGDRSIVDTLEQSLCRGDKFCDVLKQGPQILKARNLIPN